mmetsp:Transcript_17864/g.49539  ORF Transcript_17864/g.49539 Transcript_17864/m.49539 type:complete len:380 (-) Transcript_17864:228-1367(-)|eukprot:CAMPEP_0198124302 /NCGR_PEP_ID=MMETSP1442-20131203/39639_1 /TAXON_ID= /ORGANISM="Craspedostauros australis, Strain CCMP3328" /LENGTH=379 /DNA_ID=CAMNT_0043783683 /DNA_START=71 /DNA_END=1210 /DNA_ORIENTATION=+
MTLTSHLQYGWLLLAFVALQQCTTLTLATPLDSAVTVVAATVSIAGSPTACAGDAKIKGNGNSEDDTCSSSIRRNSKNSAFVFVKPHANTAATRELVKQKLSDANVRILSEISIPGTKIDRKKLIDQHYYAIASKATMLDAKDIPVPASKFEAAFGEPWAKVLGDGRAFNAMQACKYFACTPEELNEAWQKVDNVAKLGGGFYCGPMSMNDKPPIYVFNAFFMAMRAKFVGRDSAIHGYVVEWDPSDLPWSTFRNELLGPTDPSTAPLGSIRRTIYDDFASLGLSSQPTTSDNGVHASASPFEGLAEKTNWLSANLKKDPLGKALLDAGLSKKTIKQWCLDPQIKVSDTETGSVFDALEDMDVEECIETLVRLDQLNKQ